MLQNFCPYPPTHPLSLFFLHSVFLCSICSRNQELKNAQHSIREVTALSFQTDLCKHFREVYSRVLIGLAVAIRFCDWPDPIACLSTQLRIGLLDTFLVLDCYGLGNGEELLLPSPFSMSRFHVLVVPSVFYASVCCLSVILLRQITHTLNVLGRFLEVPHTICHICAASKGDLKEHKARGRKRTAQSN